MNRRPIVRCPPSLRRDTVRAFLLRLGRLEDETKSCAVIAQELDDHVVAVDLWNVQALVADTKSKLARRSS